MNKISGVTVPNVVRDNPLQYEGFTKVSTPRTRDKLDTVEEAFQLAVAMFGEAEMEIVGLSNEELQFLTVTTLDREAKSRKEWDKAQTIAPAEHIIVRLPGLRCELKQEYLTDKTRIYAKVRGVWEMRRKDGRVTGECPRLDIQAIPTPLPVTIGPFQFQLHEDGVQCMLKGNWVLLNPAQERAVAAKLPVGAVSILPDGKTTLFGAVRARTGYVSRVTVTVDHHAPEIDALFAAERLRQLGIEVPTPNEADKILSVAELNGTHIDMGVRKVDPVVQAYLTYMGDVMAGKHDEQDDQPDWEVGPGDNRQVHPHGEFLEWENCPDSEWVDELFVSADLGEEDVDAAYETVEMQVQSIWEQSQTQPWLADKDMIPRLPDDPELLDLWPANRAVREILAYVV